MKKKLLLLLFVAFSSQLFSQDFETLISKGDEFYIAKDFPEAIKYFTQAIQASPKNSKGYWYRGDSYMDSQQYGEAIKDYTKAIEIEPAFVKFYTKRGDCYYSTNLYELAEKDYNKGLELEPANATLWVYRGDCYMKLNKNDKACADYQKAHELDKQTGKSQARALSCDWTKALEKPCPSGVAPILRVEVDPFTGAVFVSKGINYSSFEFIPEKGGSYLTGPTIGKDESFDIKLLQPRNFCIDSDDNAFAGIGYNLYDSKGTELAQSDNIYGNTTEGLPSDMLKSLSMSIGLSTLEIGKNYLLKIRFFDTRGNGEVLVELPLTLAAKMDIGSNILTSEFTLGKGIKSSAVETEVKSLTFIQSDNKTPITSSALPKGKPLNIRLEGIKNLDINANYTIRFINDKGEIVNEAGGQTVLKNNTADLNLPDKNISVGTYTVWLRLEDKTGKKIGITIPVRFQ